MADPMEADAHGGPHDHEVDVVIVAYNDAEGIGAQVDGLLADDAVASVIVVDHGTDGSAVVAAAHGAITVSDPSNPGFGPGQNRGIALGRAPRLLLLNPDAQLRPGALEAGLDQLRDRPGVAAVQGVIADPGTGRVDRSGGPEPGWVDLWGRACGLGRLLDRPWVISVLRRAGRLAAHTDRAPSTPTEVETLAATAILLRRRAMEEVSGFDERFFLYGEDVDLCRRLRAAGWTLVTLPDLWADHRNGSSSAGWFDRELVWWEGTLRSAARWWSLPRLLAGLAAALVQVTRMSIAVPSRSFEAAARILGSPAAWRVRWRRNPGPFVVR